MNTKGVGTGSLQARTLVEVLGVAVLAVATRSVLVLGYVFASYGNRGTPLTSPCRWRSVDDLTRLPQRFRIV